MKRVFIVEVHSHSLGAKKLNFKSQLRPVNIRPKAQHEFVKENGK